MLSPEEALYFTMVDAGMEIHPGTLDSLREAVRNGNIYFFDMEGEPTGFVTWYFDDGDLIMNNLCLFQSGVTKLFALRKILKEKYPKLKNVKWYDERHKRVFESHIERK